MGELDALLRIVTGPILLTGVAVCCSCERRHDLIDWQNLQILHVFNLRPTRFERVPSPSECSALDN
jgi:hypothetical protein